MADAKWSDDSKFVPQTTIGPGARIMGLTGSNVNAKYPASLFVQSTETTTNYTTATTLTAASIRGGVAIFTPPDGNQAFTFDTAANIYAAMGSPGLGTYISCKFINKTTNQMFFFNSDLSFAGLASQYLNGLQTLDLDFQVTQITPTLELTVNGGTNTTFAKIFSGTIDGVIIGGSNPQNGAFLDLASSTLAVNNFNIDNDGNVFNFGGNQKYFTFSEDFLWVGDANISYGYTLCAGLGAHTVNVGVGNILLGHYATSSKNGCFVFADGSTLPGDNHYPEADNQAIFYAAGGFGVGAPANNPQAGFHYGHSFGNDGKLLLSADDFVLDAKFHNSELNPAITTDRLNWKYSDTVGAKRTLTLPLRMFNNSTVMIQGDGAAPNVTFGTNQELVCIGPLAGASIPNNPANPSRSMFIGYNSGANYTTSGNPNDQHTGVGYFSLRLLTTGMGNTALGATALFGNTSGSFNTGLGGGAGAAISTGSNNICIGYQANVSVGGATNRIVIGQGATGSTDNQVVLGNSSTTSIISNGTAATVGLSGTPFANTFSTKSTMDRIEGLTGDLRINPQASGFAVYLGHDHADTRIYIGAGSTQSLFSVGNTSFTNFMVNAAGVVTTRNNTLDDVSGNLTATGTGSFSYLVSPRVMSKSTFPASVFLAGSSAGNNINFATTSQDACLVGLFAGFNLPNIGGTSATAIGNGALSSHTGASNDQITAVGKDSLRNSTTGQYNQAFGDSALFNLTTSTQNCAVGNQAGYNLKTGLGSNTMVGNSAGTGAPNASFTNSVSVGFLGMINASTCDSVTIVGYLSGNSITTGSFNTLIGANNDISTGAGTNRTVLGNTIIADTDNEVVLGNSANTSIVSFGTNVSLGKSSRRFGTLYTKEADGLSISSAKLFLDNQQPSAIGASATLTPAQLFAKVIPVSSASVVNLDWGTAATILAAMTAPVVGGTLDLMFVNFGSAQLNITNTTDPTHIGTAALIGGASVPVPPQTIFYCRLICTSTSPAAFAVFGGPSVAGASAGAALLSANNVFTGQNSFVGQETQFDSINTSFMGGNGPMYTTSTMGFSAVASGLLTTSSFTLTAAQVANIIVRLNGSLSTQSVFMPTAANFDAHILASYPVGKTVPDFTTFHLRVVNESTTATATLTANTNFLISNTTICTLAPQTYRDFLINKTANTPEYTVY